MTDDPQDRRVFVVAGSPVAEPPCNCQPRRDDVVIAADSGLRHALDWGWHLDLVIGDMDSADPVDLERIGSAGVSIVRVSAAKDETDLELALLRALGYVGCEIVICAALGGRVDHMMANILLLTCPELQGVNVSIRDGHRIIRLLRGKEEGWLRIAGESGDLLSLIPVGGDVHGVSTLGLAYPLRGETLLFGRGRGVSNVFEQPQVSVGADEGMLLVVHTLTSP